ncbi:HD domain-containing protein [Pseudothermotoga thermarum]|uniref:Metal dependent phosphohydrolase n=1 Tax=Pseudothermotoga thermarum DSM 5069 TaxID=688269 RepID=F7YXN4_9THEM|nr:HD domain-containing protein [Pseudothermotoga thermarum]AEH50678.1 metal dependent phosphohydrolase [Pseudothermotoga thermarum DSM 5069]
MYHKVSRDPIHSEIALFPLEILSIDTRPVQRLRSLSQLVGAELVYPGASHTRFAHSLGVMHIAGIYANRLFKDQSKIRIIRLAGLLHDIGHGPFSHQFDDVVYKRMQIKDGHDQYREKLLLELMPYELMECFLRIPDPRMREAVAEDLKITMKTDKISEKTFYLLMQKVNEIFEGESTGTVEFNIVQGPLGADRLDFLLRDAYYCGTSDFGVSAVDRLIRNSYIKVFGQKQILCYDVKVLDQIYASLFSRFMMYKNVYFHKTSRAADLMIQEILSLIYEPLRLEEKVKDLQKFLDLTDQSIMYMVISQFEKLLQKYTCDEQQILSGNVALTSEEEKLVKAYKLVRRYQKRDLWKVVVEVIFSTQGVDPSIVCSAVVEDTLKKIKEGINQVLSKSKELSSEDRKQLVRIFEKFDEIFKPDTPYKLSLMHPEEFLKSNVYLYDSKKDEILTFDDYMKRYPAYKIMENNLLQIVRIYATEDVRELLKKYNIIPSGTLELTTRW